MSRTEIHFTFLEAFGPNTIDLGMASDPPSPRGNFVRHNCLKLHYINHRIRHVSTLRVVALSCNSTITYVTLKTLKKHLVPIPTNSHKSCGHVITYLCTHFNVGRYMRVFNRYRFLLNMLLHVTYVIPWYQNMADLFLLVKRNEFWVLCNKTKTVNTPSDYINLMVKY